MAAMQSKVWYLKGIKLFSDLPDEEIRRMDAITQMVSVKSKEMIYLPGDPGDRIFLLKEGRVKISRLTEDGKELALDILGSGEVFGELEVLEGLPRDTMAEVLEDAAICVIKRSDFDTFIKSRPDLSIKLTKLIGFRLKRIERRIEDLVFRDVPSRLAHLLLDLARETGVKERRGIRLQVKLTHQEIANLIGSTRETVSAILGDFKRRGLIDQQKREMIILNEKDLAAISERV